jgi:hypothetical protein
VAGLPVREVEEADANRNDLLADPDVLGRQPPALDRRTGARAVQAGSGASAIIVAPRSSFWTRWMSPSSSLIVAVTVSVTR